MKRVFEFIAWVIVPFSLILVSSCEDKITDSQLVFPDTLVSYSRHVQPLFNRTCVTSGCHDGTSGGVLPNLTYYEGVRFGPPIGLVDPGKPESSRLVIAIEGNHEVPLPLTTNQINGVKQWVLEGALNN